MSLKHLINVLNKIFVREFYRMNSGFFLLVGTLAFGFMSDVEHIALAHFFVSSISSLMIPLAAWLVYLLKILHFNKKQLNQEGNSVVYNLQFLPWTEQLMVSFVFLFLQFLPAIAYGYFLVITAWKISALQSIGIVICFLIVACLSATIVMANQFRMHAHEAKMSIVKRFFDRLYTRTIVQFYSEWLLRVDPLMIAGTKIFTGLVLFGVCALYRNEMYDWRLIAMAATVCGVANLLIVYHIVRFEHHHIAWIKNLPVPVSKRYIRILLVLLIFLIPEFSVLIRNFPVNLNPGSCGLMLFYVLSLTSFFLGLLHSRSSSVEYFTRRTFWIFIALILAILFKIPLIVLAVLNITGGYILFNRYYYLYEDSE